ncbi:MAG TPA: alpha/beta hydrolase [Pseudonocardiaceae bacterium]|jgi:pimeloyl-ACP methyl ester carboxylesterase|nr:alpha/beta hydrolase [Pseudonocardiaceae bacterium]
MDYVMLHGTTQAPSAWDRVIGLLAERGHRGYAIDFPVDQPDLSTEELAQIVVDQVGDKVREPVVVAHSGGGLILPAAARRLGARHLVWLAAVVQDFAAGRGFLDEVEADRGHVFGAEWPEWTGDDPVVAAYFLFHGCDLATLRWAMTTLRPFVPMAAYRERPGPAPTAPSTYVLPRHDRTLLPEWMRTEVPERLGVTPIEIDGDHCPHVAEAAFVADLLITCAR